MMRQKRNEHNALVKALLTMEDDVKREKKISQHHKVGKCVSRDIRK